MRYTFSPAKGLRFNVSSRGTSASYSRGGRSLSLSPKEVQSLQLPALVIAATLAVIAVVVWLVRAIWCADDSGGHWMAKVVAAGLTLGLGVGVLAAYFG